MYTETPPTKYVSAIMYDGQFVVDLHKYGARPIIQPYVLWLDRGRHFFMHPGVVLSADIINDFLFLKVIDIILRIMEWLYKNTM